MFGDPNTIGQNVIPIGSKDNLSIRKGYRSVPLLNIHSEPLELSSLLVHISFSFEEMEQDEEYQSLQELRTQMRKRVAERQDLIKEKVLATKEGKQVDPSKEEELAKLNSELRVIEEQIMQNPIEKTRAAEQDKRTTLKKGRKGK